jgi:hypothetical protein
MKLILKILVFYFLLTSCQNANKKDNYQIVTYNIKDLKKNEKTLLSDLGFVDIEYVPLETKELSFIKGISDIKVCKDFFLIKFYNTILKFQNNGSFVTKIGKEGRGPNEFLIAHDLDIEKKSGNIYLVDGW